jgi:DNA repair photolyase
LPTERIKALQEAHSLGIHTWASLEPVIDPDQSLELIRQTKDFVDEYKIGRWNHDPRADRIDWKTFAEEAVELCREFGKRYYVKKDLAIFL